MSTIDTGISPRPTIRTAPTANRNPALARPAPVLAAASDDFYVGSVNISALPLQNALPQAGTAGR